MQRAFTAAEAAVQRVEAVERADKERVERAERRRNALGSQAAVAYSRLIDACHKRHAAAEQMHDAACERAKESGEEQPPMPTEASWEWHTTEVKRIDAEHEALLTTAQAAVEAAEAEANVSKAATDDALGALGVAESAVRRAAPTEHDGDSPGAAAAEPKWAPPRGAPAAAQHLWTKSRTGA